MTDLTATARLLSMLRMNGKRGQVSGLGIECLLYIAAAPRTFEELCSLTGAHNGNISRAIQAMTPHKKGDEICQPVMHLLTRKKRPQPLRGYSVHLSKGGQELLKQAGLLR